MQRPRLRFTIASMMIGTAVVGIILWIIAGLVRDGTAWFRHPPLYLVVTFPFLFTLAVTFAVTFVELRRERRRR